MADITVNGKIKVKTFQAEFLKKFPYLVPTLRMPDGSGINNDRTIASARTVANGEYKPSGEADLSINGQLTVGGFEKRFKEAFGIDCEVCYKSPGGKTTRTNAEHNQMTLASLNKAMQEKGCQIIEL